LLVSTIINTRILKIISSTPVGETQESELDIEELDNLGFLNLSLPTIGAFMLNEQSVQITSEEVILSGGASWKPEDGKKITIGDVAANWAVVALEGGILVLLKLGDVIEVQK
jgi:hypothetical protein